MILNIDTTTNNCSVNIVNAGTILSLVEEYIDNYNHIEKLHTFIKFALEGAKIKISSLNAICINKGPGSYNGIRIASSSAKGLCYILNIPLIAIDAMSIMIENLCIEDKNYLIMPVIATNSNTIYYSIFNKDKECLYPINRFNLNKFLSSIFLKKKIYIIGDNIDKYLKNNNLNYKYLFKNKISSFNMRNISEKYFIKKKFENIKSFQPMYL